MRYALLFCATASIGTAALAGPIAAGTKQRAWLAPDATPATGLLHTPTKAIEVKGATAKLIQDPNTKVWGIPVPRLGDPDYAPDNLNYTGKVPDTPLVLQVRVYSQDGRIDRSRPCMLVTDGYGVDGRMPFAPPPGAPPGGAVPIIQDFAAHGYTGVEVALRQSSGDSQDHQVGVNGYYTKYGEDGVAILNEMVRRYGCAMQGDDPKTARIGMVGASLVGGSQWITVNRPDWPAALRAIAPDAAGINHSSYSTLWFPGGMLPGPIRLGRPGNEVADVYPAHRDFDA